MRWKRTIITVALVATGIYLVAALVLTLAQRKLMYFPDKPSAAEAETFGRRHGFSNWENAASQTIGWKRLCASVPTRGQVLILHGNAGWALNWRHYAQGLQNVEPLDIYILEFPGYGTRSGKPTQKSLFAAAEEAMALLERNGPVYLVGESLGTGVAAYLAGTHPRSVAGVFLVAPYNNMTAVAKAHLPLFPAGLMLRDKYPSD